MTMCGAVSSRSSLLHFTWYVNAPDLRATGLYSDVSDEFVTAALCSGMVLLCCDYVVIVGGGVSDGVFLLLLSFVGVNVGVSADVVVLLMTLLLLLVVTVVAVVVCCV